MAQAKIWLSRGVIDPRLIIQAGYIDSVHSRQIQGNSIDLSVREVFKIDGGIRLKANGERHLPGYALMVPYKNEDGEGEYNLQPAHLYQIEFAECLALPEFVCGVTFIRSSMGKSGCAGENGLYDSGYRGSCGMAVSVKFDSFVEKGASIAQMVFFRASARKASYQGYYQGTKGPKDWLQS